jgi:hypothetical protein
VGKILTAADHARVREEALSMLADLESDDAPTLQALAKKYKCSLTTVYRRKELALRIRQEEKGA